MPNRFDPSKSENAGELSPGWDSASRAADRYVSGDAETRKDYLKKQKREHRLKKGPMIAIGAIAAVALLGTGAAAFGLYGYQNVYPGVRAMGIEASGMSRDDLAERLAGFESDLYDGKSAAVEINRKEYLISTDDVSADLDTDQIAADAYAYGRSGSPFARIGAIVSGLTGGGYDVPVTLRIDEGAVRQKAAEIANDASMDGNGTDYEIRGNTLILTLNTLDFAVDANEIHGILMEKFQSADFSTYEYGLSPDDITFTEFQAALQKLEGEAANAYLDLASDPTGSTIVPHQDGLKIDMDKARRAFESRQGRVVEVPVEATIPKITTEHLTEVLFRDTLADVSTELNANLKGRTSNVRLAAAAADGTILNPGDEFSFNKVVGERTPARGYQMAKVYKATEVIDDIGGGICQVSSTLYMAALYSDLKISERYNHRYTVNYAPLGQDATVSYGNLDFKFINDTEYPIKIKAEQSGSQISVQMLGTKENTNTVKIETSVLSKTPFETYSVEDANMDYGSSTNNGGGYTGYRTISYRIILDANGNELSRAQENTSTYVKLDKITTVGTKGKPAPNPVTDTPVTTPPTSPENPVVDPTQPVTPPPTY